MKHVRRLARTVVGAAVAFGVGACSAEAAVQPAALSGVAEAGSQTSSSSAGTAPLAGAGGATSYVSPASGAPGGGFAGAASAANTASAAGVTSAGGAGPAVPVARAARFDAGSDPSRNKVSALQLCTRLAAINCAGEAYCCETRTRTVEMCQVELTNMCQNDLLLDQIALNPIAGFDLAAAERAYSELERKASACDPSVAAWASSHEGLRGILHGTFAPNSDCSPPQGDTATLAASLVACAEPQSYACAFASPLAAWTCLPKVGAGGTCNTDNNCSGPLFCAIAALATTGVCTERKAVGADCAGPTECVSLFCKSAKCVEANPQAAYCLQN